MNRAAATKIIAITTPIKTAIAVLIRAEVFTPRMFSSVNTTAKKIFQPQHGNSRSKRMRLLRAPDGADQRVEHVIHHHAPTSYIAGSRMDLLPAT